MIGATVDGGYAELCLVPASHVYPVPDDMPIEHAATFPTCYLTAAHGLFERRRADGRRDRADPRRRLRRVGCGDPARRSTRARPCWRPPAATPSASEALELGADHVLNNRTGDVAGWARRGDRRCRACGWCFDHVGTALFGPSLFALGVTRPARHVRQLVRRQRPRSRRSDTCSTPASRSSARTRTGPTSSGRRGRRSARSASRSRSTPSSRSPRRRRRREAARQRRVRQDPAAAVIVTMFEPRDAPYPELKKTHTMARSGRPYTDVKPAAGGAGVGGDRRTRRATTCCWRRSSSTCSTPWARAARRRPAALAERLGVSAPHLASLLDGVVALGLLDKVGDDYELNDTARRYLVSDGPASWRSCRRWRQGRTPTGRGSPTPCVTAGRRRRSRTIPRRSTSRWWRARSRRCGERRHVLDLQLRYSPRPAGRGCSTSVPAAAPWAIAMLAACPDGERRRQRPDRRARRRPPTSRSSGVVRPVRVPAGRLLRDRDRGRPRTTSSCSATSVEPRAPTARRTVDPACVRRAAARRPGDRRRLLPGSGAQAQPARRADGRDDDGQHARTGSRSRPSEFGRWLRTPASPICDWSSRSGSNRCMVATRPDGPVVASPINDSMKEVTP